MDKRSTGYMAEEWRKQGLSGQHICRPPIGAACRGGILLQGVPTSLIQVNKLEAGERSLHASEPPVKVRSFIFVCLFCGR